MTSRTPSRFRAAKVCPLATKLTAAPDRARRVAIMPPMAPAPKMQNFGDTSSGAVFICTPLEALAVTASIVARVRRLLLRVLRQKNRGVFYAYLFSFDFPLFFVGGGRSCFRSLQIENTRFSETFFFLSKLP